MDCDRAKNIKNFLKVEDLLRSLTNVQASFPSVREHLKTVCTSYQLKNFETALGVVCNSSTAIRDFGNNKHILSVFNQLPEKKMENFSFQKARIGSTENLNRNTGHLVMCEDLADHDSFFEVISALMFGSANASSLLKLFVLYKLVKDFVKLQKLAMMYDLNWSAIFDEINSDTKFPMPFIVLVLSKVLEKNIFVHVASHNKKNMTFEFSEKYWKKNIHLIMNDGRFYGVVEARLSRIRMETVTPAYRLQVEGSDVIESVFGEVAKMLLSKCSFCEKFAVDRCPHILPCHSQATDSLKDLMAGFKFLDASHVPPSMIFESIQLPGFLSSSIVVTIRDTINPGDSYFSSISVFLTGNVEMALALRKAAAAEFIQNEHKYRLWFEHEGWSSFSFTAFRENVLAMDAFGGEHTSAILSKILERPVVHFRKSISEPGRVFSLTEHMFTSNPICLLYVDTDNFQPLIPKCWTDFHVSTVSDEVAKSRSEIFLLHDLYLQSHLKIANGKIISSTLAPETRIKDTASFQKLMPKFKRDTNMDMFVRIMESELKTGGRLNENGIRKFVQRTSSLCGFWIPKIQEDGIKENRKDLLRRGKTLSRVQETDSGRQKVAELLATYHIPQEFIDMYKIISKERFHNVTHSKITKSNKLNTIDRKCKMPEYDDADRCGDLISLNDRQESESVTFSEFPTQVDSEFGMLRWQTTQTPDFYEREDAFTQENESECLSPSEDQHDAFTLENEEECSSRNEHQGDAFTQENEEEYSSPSEHPGDAFTQENEEQCSSPSEHHDDVFTQENEGESPSSSQASKSSSVLEKEELADAMGISIPGIHSFGDQFDIRIPASSLEDVYDFDGKQFFSADMANAISEEISEKTGCSFSNRRPPYYYSRRRRRRNKFCTFAGYCGCKLEMKVIIKSSPRKGENLVCNVKNLGSTSTLQTTSTSRQCRGNARKRLVKKLENQKPTKFMLSEASQLSQNRLLHGNQVVASINVPRTVRSQTASQLVFSKDIEVDLKHLKKELEEKYPSENRISGFIQRASFDNNLISVIMYDEPSLKLLMNLGKTKGFELHMDATGSVCNKENTKEILYFLLLASSDNHGSFPIAHMLTQRSRASDLAQFFIKLKADMLDIRSSFNKSIAPVMITDMSLPIINGALQGLNKQSLGDYILTCYHILSDKCTLQKDRILLSLCANHLIKAMSRSLSKFLTATRHHKAIRKLALHALVRLQECESLQDVARVYKVIIEFFSKDKLDPNRTQEYKNFLSNASYEEQDLLRDNSDVLEQIEDDMNTESRASSPFFKLFEATENIVKGQETFEINEYHNDGVINLLKNHYVPYLPLFCAAMIKKTQRSDFNRLSNAVVESEFNTIKHNFHSGSRQPIGVFIRKHHLYHVGKTRSLLLNPRKKRTRARSAKRIQNPLQDEEAWSKRSKVRKPAYVRKRKRFSPQTISQVDDILQNEIFTMASETLAENIRSLPNHPVETSCPINVPSVSQEEIDTPVPKNLVHAIRLAVAKRGPTIPRKSTATFDDLQKQFVEQDVVNEDVGQSLENLAPRMEKAFKKAPGLLAQIKGRDAAMKQDVRREKLREIEKTKRKQTTGKESSNSSKHSNTTTKDKPDNIILNYNVAPPCSNPADILCTINNDLPILDSPLTKQNLADFVNEDVMIEGNHVDFYLSLQKDLNRESKYMVSSFNYCLKYTFTDADDGLVKQSWNYDPSTQTEDPVNTIFEGQDESRILHFANVEYLIHPLFESNHWRLLVLDFNSKRCTILDSLMPSTAVQHKKIREYKKYVIPKFLKKSKANDAENWELTFCRTMQQQHDVMSCGLLTMAAARELLSQGDTMSIDEAIKDIQIPSVERQNMLFEMLATTNEGRALMESKEYKYAEIKSFIEK